METEDDSGAYPRKLIRQASGQTEKNCYCTDNVGKSVGDLRLGCGCLVHYQCLVKYIRVKLEDKNALLNSFGKQKENGIVCPYALADECNNGERYYMTTGDLNSLVSFGIDNHTSEYLKSEEVDKMRRWIEEHQSTSSAQLDSTMEMTGDGNNDKEDQPQRDSGDMLVDKFINATTKKCPNCSYRASHYHGHACHHISPGGGCPQCHHHYCYRCESSADMNLRERGANHLCKCGGWSNFCKPLKTCRDIRLHLVTQPYPHDKRCGCPLCPDVSYCVIVITTDCCMCVTSD
jgi:hypothetical protein